MTRLGGIHHAVIEQLARLVHYGHLATGAIARVEREHARATYRTGGKQPLEVLGKDVDGFSLRTDRQVGAGLAFKRGGHQALVAVGDGGVEHGREHTLTPWPAAAQTCGRRSAINLHAHAQLALALATIDGQHAMVGDLAQRLVVGVIRFVGGLFVRIGGLDLYIGRVLRKGTQVGDVFGIFGYRLGNDVAGAGKGLLGRIEAGFGIHVGSCGVRGRAFGGCLHDDHVGERLQARLARLLRARHALLAEGLVQVLHALQLRGFADLGLKLGRELALCVDEQKHVLFALLKVAQIRKALVERAQRHVVHATRGFLAVARDKGDGVAFVDQRDGGLDVGGLEVELFCELGDKIHEAPQVRISGDAFEYEYVYRQQRRAVHLRCTRGAKK